MKILAIETSSDIYSVALKNEENVMELSQTSSPQTAHLILQRIETLLKKANFTLKELDALALSQGPGSFTGIRMGASVAQALAFAAQCPVVLVSSLQVLAQSAYRQLNTKKVLTAVDARMGDIYWGAYNLDDQNLMQAVFPDILCKPKSNELLNSLQQAQGRARFEEGIGWKCVGNAWEVYNKELILISDQGVDYIGARVVPHASDLLSVAVALFEKGKSVSAEQALPIYLRDASAWKKISEQR